MLVLIFWYIYLLFKAHSCSCSEGFLLIWNAFYLQMFTFWAYDFQVSEIDLPDKVVTLIYCQTNMDNYLIFYLMQVTILFNGRHGLSSNKLILYFWHSSCVIAEQILQNIIELPRAVTVPWCTLLKFWYCLWVCDWVCFGFICWYIYYIHWIVNLKSCTTHVTIKIEYMDDDFFVRLSI